MDEALSLLSNISHIAPAERKQEACIWGTVRETTIATVLVTADCLFVCFSLQVIFAFMVGLHNLYWYYGLQLIKPPENTTGRPEPATEVFEGSVLHPRCVLMPERSSLFIER